MLLAIAKPIDSFSNEYFFLSNFYYQPFLYQDKIYPTVEHAFQAAKTNNTNWKERIRRANDPSIAKTLGRQAPMRQPWDNEKVQVMRELIQIKFAPGTPLATQLLSTGTAQLIEGNTWNDQFWGVCRGRGKNWLGKLLMEQRKSLNNRKNND